MNPFIDECVLEGGALLPLNFSMDIMGYPW